MPVSKDIEQLIRSRISEIGQEKAQLEKALTTLSTPPKRRGRPPGRRSEAVIGSE